MTAVRELVLCFITADIVQAIVLCITSTVVLMVVFRLFFEGLVWERVEQAAGAAQA